MIHRLFTLASIPSLLRLGAIIPLCCGDLRVSLAAASVGWALK